MTSRAETLRRNCTRYINQLKEAGTDPVIITAFRALVGQNISTAENARRLWADNMKLRAEIAELLYVPAAP